MFTLVTTLFAIGQNASGKVGPQSCTSFVLGQSNYKKEPFPEVQVLYNVLRPSFTNVH
jgi:hypothetical protein